MKRFFWKEYFVSWSYCDLFSLVTSIRAREMIQMEGTFLYGPYKKVPSIWIISWARIEVTRLPRVRVLYNSKWKFSALLMKNATTLIKPYFHSRSTKNCQFETWNVHFGGNGRNHVDSVQCSHQVQTNRMLMRNATQIHQKLPVWILKCTLWAFWGKRPEPSGFSPMFTPGANTCWGFLLEIFGYFCFTFL